jgi:hypothetical protein
MEAKHRPHDGPKDGLCGDMRVLKIEPVDMSGYVRLGNARAGNSTEPSIGDAVGGHYRNMYGDELVLFDEDEEKARALHSTEKEKCKVID